MALVAESPIRYATVVSAGLKPMVYSMGIRMGARIIHLAEPEVMNRFRKVDSSATRKNRPKPVKPVDFSQPPPTAPR